MHSDGIGQVGAYGQNSLCFWTREKRIGGECPCSAIVNGYAKA